MSSGLAWPILNQKLNQAVALALAAFMVSLNSWFSLFSLFIFTVYLFWEGGINMDKEWPLLLPWTFIV